MADIIPFRFEANEVRVVTVAGEQWFITADVARALGYADSDALAASER